MDSCVVYIPVVQNNQGSDESKDSVLVCTRIAAYFLFLFLFPPFLNYHVVQESGEEADAEGGSLS